MKYLNINSLRFRLVLTFSVTFLVLLLLLLSVVGVFFETYYMSANERVMRNKVHQAVGEGLVLGPNGESLGELSRGTGGTVILVSSDMDVQDAGPGESNTIASTKRNPWLTKEDLQGIYEGALEGGHQGFFQKTEEMIHYAFILPHGDMLLISKQMGLVREAEALFRAFINRAAIGVYIVGLLLIIIMTHFLTKPVLEMKHITANMANLDFSEGLNPSGAEETRSLMNSINTMGKKLSDTIDHLNTSNGRLERELTKERSLEKMRRQFVSDVSHELKNPLAVIMGYADGLIQGIPKTEASKKAYYKIIMDEAERMNKLVKDLLDLAAFESGTFTINKETFVVNDLISDTIERFSYIVEDKEVQIDYNAGEVYVLEADRLRISQVMINILSNAFKHVDDGGTIRIDLEEAEQKLRITIANTGKLIPENALEDIWNSFYQVDTENKGNGLGLAIVKSIVKLHDGYCRAYTTDRFNCFEVIL